MNAFLEEEVNYDDRIRKREDNLAVRFCRKKYKCLVIFMLLLISFFQAAIMLSTHITSLMEMDVFNMSKSVLSKISNATDLDVFNMTKSILNILNDTDTLVHPVE